MPEIVRVRSCVAQSIDMFRARGGVELHLCLIMFNFEFPLGGDVTIPWGAYEPNGTARWALAQASLQAKVQYHSHGSGAWSARFHLIAG